MELVLSREDQVVVVANVFSRKVKRCDSAEEFYDRIRAAEDQQPLIAVGGWVRRHFVGALTGRSRKAQAAFIRELREGERLAMENYEGEQWCKTLPPRDLAPPPGGAGFEYTSRSSCIGPGSTRREGALS